MFYETLTTNVFMTSNNKTTNSQIHEVKCCIKTRELGYLPNLLQSTLLHQIFVF